MAAYTIRPGFTINLLGTIYQGGQEVELNDLQFKRHKQKLEGVESDVAPIDFGANNNGECCYPAPFIASINPAKILTGKTQIVTVYGSFFTPDITVEIEAGTIDNIEFISSNELKLTVTTTNDAGDYDLIIDNGKQTVSEDGISFFAVPAGLVDLRRDGTAFSNSAIEMRSGMSFTREADGLIFTGSNPWSSWARFVGDSDAWVWNRSSKKTLSWIYQNTSSFMVGIGSRANNRSSSTQYYQAELLSYSNSATRLSSLYGNNGSPGSGRSQGFSANKAAIDIIKAVFTNNGENGGVFSVYRLPDSNLTNWLDLSNQLGQVTISGFGADEPEIMPFAISRSGVSTKFLGFILEDE